MSGKTGCGRTGRGCQLIDTWTRKSTNGGLIRLLTHLIKSWSNTHSVVALPSGEAEYYGLVRGASIGLGLKAILGDLGIAAEVTIMK